MWCLHYRCVCVCFLVLGCLCNSLKCHEVQWGAANCCVGEVVEGGLYCAKSITGCVCSEEQLEVERYSSGDDVVSRSSF